MVARGLAEIRVVLGLLWTVLILGLGFWLAGKVSLPMPSLPRPQIDEKVTLALLQSEQLTFLVTRRTTTQIVVEHSESDWSGEWRGVLWATVSWRWGVDMRKVAASDLRREGDLLLVKLPDPELLDFGIEPGSTGYICKATALPKLMDFSRGGGQRQQLEARLREQTLKFAAQRQMLPTRQEILTQLNQAAEALGQSGTIHLRFE